MHEQHDLRLPLLDPAQIAYKAANGGYASNGCTAPPTCGVGPRLPFAASLATAPAASIKLAQITDGTSNTMLIGENSPNLNSGLAWVSGNDIYANDIFPELDDQSQDGQVDPSTGEVCSPAAWNPSSPTNRSTASTTSGITRDSRASIPAAQFWVLRWFSQVPQADDQRANLYGVEHSSRWRDRFERRLLKIS